MNLNRPLHDQKHSEQSPARQDIGHLAGGVHLLLLMHDQKQLPFTTDPISPDPSQ